MKIYFAGSIRGGRDDKELYTQIVAELKKYGSVLTEHVGHKFVSDLEGKISEEEIFNRDMSWLKESQVVVAEITTPSLGVGYELSQAEFFKKPVLCLYRNVADKKISAMIAGNSYFSLCEYKDIGDIKNIFTKFFNDLGLKDD